MPTEQDKITTALQEQVEKHNIPSETNTSIPEEISERVSGVMQISSETKKRLQILAEKYPHLVEYVNISDHWITVKTKSYELSFGFSHPDTISSKYPFIKSHDYSSIEFQNVVREQPSGLEMEELVELFWESAWPYVDLLGLDNGENKLEEHGWFCFLLSEARVKYDHEKTNGFTIMMMVQ